MQDKELGEKVVNGMKWKALERIILQVVNAVTPMVLARILMPEDFGTIAILTVFISIANTFVNNGLGTSVIQKKDSDEIDFSTVFYTQVFIAVICYVVLFAASPLIGKFYNDNSLVLMLRVMSLSIVIGSLGSMQITIMKKNMEFNKSFLINGSATIIYGVVGIGMAYSGFGCWSLVWANLANITTLWISSILVVKWKPKLKFSFFRLKSLFSYSWKLMVGWLIGTLHQDFYTIVIGKRFSSATLGYYNRAGSFPQIITKTVTEVVDGVMFPALSQIHDEKEKLKSMTRTLLSMNSYILFPIFFGLAAVSKNLVILVLTEKWLPCVPMMQIVCVTYALNSINNSNMQVFNSMGHSDIFMKFELIKRSTSIVLLFLMSYISIYAVIAVLLFMAILSNFMNAYQNKKLLGYTYSLFFSDIVPSFIIAAIMAIITWLIGLIKLPLITSLLLQIICGMIVYLALSIMIKSKSFRLLIELLRNVKNGKVNRNEDI